MIRAPASAEVNPGPRLVRVPHPDEGWETWFQARCGDLDAAFARRLLAQLLRIDAGIHDLWTDGCRLLFRKSLGPVQHAILTTRTLLMIAPVDVATMLALVSTSHERPALERTLAMRAAREARRDGTTLEDIPLYRTGRHS